MAEVIPLRCPKCDFRTSSDSVGFRYINKAIKCLDCNWAGDSTISSTVDMKTWEDHEPRCIMCESANVIDWDRKCPNCNIDVIRDIRYEPICAD